MTPLEFTSLFMVEVFIDIKPIGSVELDGLTTSAVLSSTVSFVEIDWRVVGDDLS